MPQEEDEVNPVDEYMEQKKTAAQRRREDDLALVQQWQQQDQAGQVDPNLTAQLMQRFEPVRRAAQNKYKAALTGPGFDTKSRTLMIDSFRSFDPTRGASPSTHMTGNLRRLYRENLQQQSVQNTEADAGLFGPMDVAHAELEDELGRAPTPEEHFQRMNESLPAKKRIDMNRFQQVQQRRGGAVLSSGFESNPEAPVQLQHQQALQQQNLDLLPYDLDEQETAVYNHLFGRGGQKATTSTNVIANRLGISAPSVSRLRKRVAQKAGVTEQQLSAGRKPRAPNAK